MSRIHRGLKELKGVLGIPFFILSAEKTFFYVTFA